MSDKINSKTAEGLFAFCDFMVEKGYATTAAMDPWKTAARKVFGAVYGEEGFESETLDGIDLDDVMSRFETLTRGQYKHESVVTYGRRVRSAVEGYMEFLDTGRPPQLRRARTTPAKKAESKAPAAKATKKAATEPTPMGELIKFPFPLRSGEMVQLQLPARLQREDADRLSAFLRTLQVEAPKEIPVRTGEEAQAA